MDTTRQTLEQLNKDELIDIILELKAEVASLKAKLEAGQKPDKTSQNSSIPSSQTRKGKQKR